MDQEQRNWIYSDVRFDIRPIVELALMTNDEEWFHYLLDNYRINKEV